MTLNACFRRFLPLAAALPLMTACGGSTEAPPVALSILPTAHTACPGDTVPMLLATGGQAGDPASATWASSDTLLPINAHGVIQVRGYGSSTITAVDGTDPGRSATATVNFPDPVVQPPTVHRITREGSSATVPADSLSDTVNISIDAPSGLTCNNAYLSQANLIVVRGTAPGVLVDHIDAAPIQPGQSLSFTFNTDSASSGAPVFPDGTYTLYVTFTVHASFDGYDYALTSRPMSVAITN